MALKQGWEYVNPGDENNPNALVRNTQTGQMVTASHPTYTSYGETPGTGSTPGGPAATPPPTPYSISPEQQQFVVNSYMDRAKQGTTIDPNDPNIKQQVEPFAAAQERQKRDYLNARAEKLGAQGVSNSGQMQNEERYAAERAGQNVGTFHAQLVGQELQNRRDEIKDALTNLKGMLSQDQENQLRRELADLDATLKREGYGTQVNIANQENATRMTLGQQANSIDLLKALLQNQQFGQGQALDWSKFDWLTNPMNPANW